MLKPGSFSRNFAWGGGEGLRKLHSAIRLGFAGSAVAVSREEWRSRIAGLASPDQSIIPPNFFLLNDGRALVVDELVLQALNAEHSASFDLLSIFAFHLSDVGTPPDTAEDYPALWANEFVRSILWSDGAWHAEALTEERVDGFLSLRVDATEEVRHKVGLNYRHILRIAGFDEGAGKLNTVPDQWAISALYLAWDRHTFRVGDQSKDKLIDYANGRELFKLIGVPKSWTDAAIEAVSESYLELGGRTRLVTTEQQGQTQLELNTVTFDQYEQSESDLSVRRSLTSQLRQVRNQTLSVKLKRLYDNKCVFCGMQLPVGPDEFYSEAAHIQALGEPNNGPDVAANMIVLCPHHHLQFDRGVLSLKKSGSGYVIQSIIPGDVLTGKFVSLRHEISEAYVQYHSKRHGFST